MPNKHPLSYSPQKFIVPSDAVSGDQIGEVGFAYTFVKFWNHYQGTSLVESDFRFLKFSGPSNFLVDSLTGMISINNMTGITADTSISVRVSIADRIFDVTCDIVYADDCIYFDPDFAGTSTGSRSAPYLKINGSGLTPTAGKSYFWRRGKTFSREWAVIVNPKIDGEYPDWITFDAWGSGDRPIIDGTDQQDGGTLRRFVDFGGGSFNNDDTALEGNKFRIANFSTRHDKSDDFYPFLIKGLGNYAEYRRIDMEETTFSEGFMYFAVKNDLPYENRYFYLDSIKTLNSEERSIKIEAGGVIGKNFRCRNIGATLTEHPAPGSANHPYVDLMFIDAWGDNISSSNLGLQIRSSNVTYEWCWLKDFGNALVAYIHIANDGRGGVYEVKEGGFRNIVIEGSKEAASYFGRQGGTTDVATGIYFDRINVLSGKGFQVNQGAVNTLFKYCQARDTDADGFRVFEGTGSGTKLHNCTAFDNASNDIELSRTGVEITNTNYGTLSGTAVETTNSNSEDPLVLDGAGTDLGYLYDLVGGDVANPPSIGVYEFSAVTVIYSVSVTASNGNVSGAGDYNENEEVTVTLIAVANSGYVFSHWEEAGNPDVTTNPLVFAITEDRTFIAVFISIPLSPSGKWRYKLLVPASR